MKLQIALVLLTLLTGIGAVMTRGWPWRILWLFGVLNFGLLTLAYAGRRPEIWGKLPDGRLPLGRTVLMLPVHALSQVTFQTMKLFTASRPFDEIEPGVFLGRRLTGSEATLKEFGAVLDLTSEFAEPVHLRQATNYLCVPVLDHTPPTPAQLRTAVDFLTAHRAGGPVLVHCAAGHGRSALVVAAFLLEQGRVTTAAEAVAQLQRLRPNVKLNAAQRASLEEFARNRSVAGGDTAR